MKVTVKQLQSNVKELLETASKGEEIIITHRGKPYAKLISLEPEQPEQDQLFGMWKDDLESQDVNNYISKIRKGRFNAN